MWGEFGNNQMHAFRVYKNMANLPKTFAETSLTETLQKLPQPEINI